MDSTLQGVEGFALGEQGMDTTQLQQAMDQVDPEEFNRMADEGGEVVDEEMPA
jgi:hypothetical protein